MAKKAPAKKAPAKKKAVKKTAPKPTKKSLPAKKAVAKKAAAKRPAGRVSAMSRRAIAAAPAFPVPTDTMTYSEIAKFTFLFCWMQDTGGTPFQHFSDQVGTIDAALRNGTLAGSDDLKMFVHGIATNTDQDIAGLITQAQVAVGNLKIALSNNALWGPCATATMDQVAVISQMDNPE